MDVLKIMSLAEFSSEKYVRVPIKNSSGLVRLLCFEPSQEVALHKHSEADEIFYVVTGAAAFTKGNETIQLDAGSIVKAEAGMFHGWRNGSTRLILFSVLIPLVSYNVADQAARMEFA